MGFSDLFFDRRCCLCDKHIDKGAVCSECDSKLVSLIRIRKRRLGDVAENVELYYLFDYDEPIVKKLLFRLKRSANSDLFKYASRLYYTAVPEDFSGTVVICPRRKKSLRDYGYDHVEKPCALMCKAHKERLSFERLLKRKGRSKEQKNLTLSQRKENTKGIFRVIKKDIPENILLVDDVVTTASTINSCVDELFKCRSDAKIVAVCLASRNAFAGKG